MRKLIALLLFVVPAVAHAQTWRIDPGKSTVGFTVRHMVVSKAKGKFGSFSGTVTGNPADPAAAHIEITINPASVNTGNTDRDADLCSPNFFDVAKYPTSVFRSKRITRAGSGLTVVGDLTLHGVTKEVTLDVERFATVGNNRVQATAKAKINRKDFGITWNKTLDGGGVTVSDEVNLQIDAEFVRQ